MKAAVSHHGSYCRGIWIYLGYLFALSQGSDLWGYPPAGALFKVKKAKALDQEVRGRGSPSPSAGYPHGT